MTRKAKPCSAKVVDFVANPPPLRATTKSSPQRLPGIRLQDLVIMTKLSSRDWTLDPAKGEIISTRTGNPLRFCTNDDGYQETSVTFHGRRVKIQRHRAVYIAGACRTYQDLPTDFDLQVDHINGDIADCRFENLRLIPSRENNRPKSGYMLRFFSSDEVARLRERYAKGVSPPVMAAEFGVSRSTIWRLVTRRTYKEVP